MRILVVEDYAPVRDAVVKALREGDYSVDETTDGEKGLEMALVGGYDLVVLDLMLPGLDGLELLQRLRRGGEDCHVLILTARDEVGDRIKGLDLGADDYLVKPFAMAELLARVRALLRREYVTKTPILRVGHVTIDTGTHAVKVGEEVVKLTAKEYALLEYLAFRRDQVVSRNDIWQHIYDGRASTSSNVVDVYIGYLRRKLELPGKPRLLHTRRGEGYLLSEDPA